MSKSGFCSLIIEGDNLDFDLIEETLEMEATEKRKKGEMVNSIIGKMDHDLICFEERGEGKYNPDAVLIILLNKLENKDVFLKDLSQKAHVYIRCFVQSDYAQIYYMLSAEMLQKISQLDIDLGMSIFSWGGVKDDRKKKKRKEKKKDKKNKKNDKNNKKKNNKKSNKKNKRGNKKDN